MMNFAIIYAIISYIKYVEEWKVSLLNQAWFIGNFLNKTRKEKDEYWTCIFLLFSLFILTIKISQKFIISINYPHVESQGWQCVGCSGNNNNTNLGKNRKFIFVGYFVGKYSKKLPWLLMCSPIDLTIKIAQEKLDHSNFSKMCKARSKFIETSS